MNRLSRRRFVQLGIGGTVILSSCGALLAWSTSGYAFRPGEVALALSPKELAVARAVVETLLPGGDGLPSGVELGIPQRIDEQVWAAAPESAGDLEAALQLLEHVPPLFGHYHRFTALDPESRQDVYAKLLKSRRDLLAAVAVALKQMAELLYFGHEAVWPAIGYDGPWIKQRKPPESALAYARLLRERGGEIA
jgi:Gluconate 2-dehydrogenase subunit 3